MESGLGARGSGSVWSAATGPEGRSSRGGGAPRELAGVGPRQHKEMLTERHYPSSRSHLREPANREPRRIHLTNTFGIIANGSPRRKTRRGAVNVVSARRSFRPRKADSSALRSEAPNGLAIDS